MIMLFDLNNDVLELIKIELDKIDKMEWKYIYNYNYMDAGLNILYRVYNLNVKDKRQRKIETEKFTRHLKYDVYSDLRCSGCTKEQINEYIVTRNLKY